jgi:hypothetical protein
MEAFTGQRVPSWGWGTERQLFACRLFQAFGLLAVLGMLLVLGWMPGG